MTEYINEVLRQTYAEEFQIFYVDTLPVMGGGSVTPHPGKCGLCRLTYFQTVQ